MHVKSLRLEHFRNYRLADVDFSPAQNLILGDNGQGKTNLLEAIYLLSHARSHRTNDDRQLLWTPSSAWGKTTESVLSTEEEDLSETSLSNAAASWAKVTVETSSADGLADGLLEARIRMDSGRLKTTFLWNAVPLKSRSAVLGHLPTVSFFLPDLLLLRGTPDDRRRWLDAAISQIDRRHLAYLSEFQRIRQQKSRLLKQPPELVDRSHVQVWNEQFAAIGAQVMASRLAYLSQIVDLAETTYLELSDAAERLGVAYAASVWPDGSPVFSSVHPTSLVVPDVSVLQESLHTALQERMVDELRRGTCLIGPHRDDILFTLNNLAADDYGSQGQQRGVVLALKLAELQCLTAKLGHSPILLMDDVMAELDPLRQRLLLEHIQPDSQLFLTTTHTTGTWRSLLDDQSTAVNRAVFRIEAGMVRNNAKARHE